MDSKEEKVISILLVDDDEDEYVIARDLFFEIGSHYRLHWVDDFRQGLEEIMKKDHQLCLLDYHLGTNNGVEFIKEAALRGCTVPIILLTGQGDHETDLAAMKAGATDYLDKRELAVGTLERMIRYTLERKKAEEKIRFLAYYDQLTCLPNRTLFFDRLKVAFSIAERYSRICAVMFLDIDNFKRINDSLGHSMGDLLIREVGSRLQKCIRKEDTITRDRFDSLLDTVARLGGDEFTILLSEINEPDNATRVVERIRRMLLSPVLLGGKPVNITVSIGIALYPADGRDMETLIKNADIAMYNAKSIGKNNFRYFNNSMNSTALQKLTLETELRNALENNELAVYYQPMIELPTRKLKGIETLVYWEHPRKGVIQPAEFIGIAEETGLIVDIGHFVFRIVGKQYEYWHRNGLMEEDMDITINISPRQLYQKDFLDTVKNWINEYDLFPGHLIFDISENCIIRNTEEVHKIITAIRALGIRIAMDDFGSGYSSFIVLKQIDFDILKIDRTFISNIPESVGDSTIVASFISIGHSMDLKVLASGIERKEQLDFLEANHCDMGQGYYFSTPVPDDELGKIVNE